MVTEPRKHHYLPRFYLRGFAAGERGLFQVEKCTGRAVRASINDLAAIRDFHRIDADGVEDPFQLERELAEVEGLLASELAAALAGGLVSADVHAGLVQLLSLLRFRVPAVREFFEGSLRQYVRSTGLIMERAGQLPVPPAGLEGALCFSDLRIEISNWICLHYMFQMAFDPRLLNLLLTMHPTIIEATGGTTFVTSDQPVAVFHPKARPTDLQGVAVPDPETELSLPLSSRKLLLLTWSDGAPESRMATDTEVQEFNRRTVIMASSYIFSGVDDAGLLQLIADNGQRFAGFETPDVIDRGQSFLHFGRYRGVCPPDQYAAHADAESCGTV